MRLHVEWGLHALNDSAPVAVIVDCLSFSTAVSVACESGGRVFPFYDRRLAGKFSTALGLDCAGLRKDGGRTISPQSLEGYSGAGIVLPSPNGSRLSLCARRGEVYCGALRNASAVAKKVETLRQDTILVAAGERWADGSLRPCFEDWIACGAIASKIPALKTPEVVACIAAFAAVQKNLQGALSDCLSGLELAKHGFAVDVEWASKIDASERVAKLQTLEVSYADYDVKLDEGGKKVLYYQV